MALPNLSAPCHALSYQSVHGLTLHYLAPGILFSTLHRNAKMHMTISCLTLPPLTWPGLVLPCMALHHHKGELGWGGVRYDQVMSCDAVYGGVVEGEVGRGKVWWGKI